VEHEEGGGVILARGSWRLLQKRRARASAFMGGSHSWRSLATRIASFIIIQAPETPPHNVATYVVGLFSDMECDEMLVSSPDNHSQPGTRQEIASVLLEMYLGFTWDGQK
jgi:hypothetical protein